MARRAIWPAAAAVAFLALVAVLVLGQAHGHASTAKPGPFSWLRPASVPAGWGVAMTPGGAALAYPPSWHPIESDSGTKSAAPAGGPLASYLNATPLGGPETLANWSRFRPAHVADEGARHVRLISAAAGLRFRTGHGSCVIDAYSTRRMRFREIACIVEGNRATTVVVAAAPESQWAQRAPLLERAVASFAT